MIVQEWQAENWIDQLRAKLLSESKNRGPEGTAALSALLADARMEQVVEGLAAIDIALSHMIDGLAEALDELPTRPPAPPDPPASPDGEPQA